MSFENGTPNRYRNGYLDQDQFQGGIKFEDTAQINFPTLAFYLTDSTASYLDSAKIPTEWVNGDAGDIRRFDGRKATLYSEIYDSRNGGWNNQAIAEITISPNAVFEAVTPVAPVPLPAAGLLLLSSLFGLGGLKISRKNKLTE